MIKDSGERTEFGTGAVRDMHSGKGRMDLLPWEALVEVSKHCEEGALKYGERNCEKGIPIHSLIDSAFRHLDMDKESSILWMLHTQFGFGPKRLKLAWKLFYAETLKLREHYLMEQADDGWLARKKLKDIGCDIEEWYREEGGKTDA